MRRGALAALAALAVLALPAVGYACPVCFDANDTNRTAFLVTTIFMSTLPLSMIGGILFWVRERSRDGR